ncbi:TPA: serine/threonine protein kinase [Vibrio parahaemolyticus]|uniref:serine/threonine-protein kinase n=1 Tax=Vibrio vulnificus TaxID=672 RepID=UPI0007354A6F|nr:serine/threonine-protein kinase [Vibrio vulnificus]HCE3020733.1 serine/threonine protein kinase [Vibrio parahaemolyticus]ELP1875724.1 serine/threonine protein kinase [Vibrio vulnificus]PNM65857.1 serine/threonine protein kinase [Vibrio vulnificus]SUQ27983.1 serine/threonine protein kinase [Vibrio vulnificus]HCE4479777.1 serine/threonine protein kinase [Vibrio parahaemolyticus]
MEVVANYKFQVIEQIGKGGFGYVEKIRLFNMSETHSGLYARKVLDPQVDLKLYNERFEKEVLCQCKCQHKNIVPIYIADLYSAKPFFIMELGTADLQDLLDSDAIEEQEKILIIESVLYGLKHIHDQGFVHRDIKPNNIILCEDGTYKISDFGLIRQTDATRESNPLTSIGLVLGTEDYMAPELRFVGNDYSEKSDIFAMGKVFEKLCVQDEDIKRIITKCSKMDPSDRYESIDQILHDIELLQGASAA